MLKLFNSILILSVSKKWGLLVFIFLGKEEKNISVNLHGKQEKIR